MNVSVDTNVLLRLAVNDSFAEADAAEAALSAADSAHVSVAAFCEFSWVLQRTYKLDQSQVAAAIRSALERKKSSNPHNIRNHLDLSSPGMS